jgi:hypothetical protein
MAAENCWSRLDQLVVGIGGGLGVGEYVLGVEDVEALVLHRPHVEVGNRDDVEQVEVVFEAIGLLVPAHGALERSERVGAAGLVSALDPDSQGDLAA